MRRTLAVLAAATALALGGGVATADSADARRNVGGIVPQGALCIDPGAVELSGQAAANAGCLCIYVPPGDGFPSSTYKNGGRGGDCPPGIRR